MGVVICAKHGMSGIAICIEKAICDKIYQNESIQDEELTIIHVEVFEVNSDGEIFVVNLNHLITKELKEKNNLQEAYKMLDEQAFDELEKKMDAGVTCGKCFQEFAQANGWSEQFINYAENNL
ncbi:MAG: hypothetical protein MUC49_13430 [Raineya sp.]|jgi:hypothetical protein|nr:hypothetical protein [Raineya sp.]